MPKLGSVSSLKDPVSSHSFRVRRVSSGVPHHSSGQVVKPLLALNCRQSDFCLTLTRMTHCRNSGTSKNGSFYGPKNSDCSIRNREGLPSFLDPYRFGEAREFVSFSTASFV